MTPKDCFAAATSVIFYCHVLTGRGVCVCVCGSDICFCVCICGCNKANPLCVWEKHPEDEMHLLLGNSSSVCSCPLIIVSFFLWISFSLIWRRLDHLGTRRTMNSFAVFACFYVYTVHSYTENLYGKVLHLYLFALFLWICLIVVFTGYILFITLYLPLLLCS